MLTDPHDQMVTIGIDASAIPPNRVGAGNYTFHLVRSLAELDHKNTYYVFGNPGHIREWSFRKPNWHAVPTSFANRPQRLLWEQIGLPRECRRLRLDVLHSPHYTSPVWKTTASVVTIHDMIFFLHPGFHTRMKGMLFPAIIRRSCRTADHLIADSRSTAADMKRVLGPDLDEHKVTVVPLGVAEYFVPIGDGAAVARVCDAYGIRRDGYLLYVGVLEPRKNIPTLLRAFRHVLSSVPGLQLVLAGQRGWKDGEVFDTIARLSLADSVVVTGHVPEADLPALYNGARVFVYPSLYEGFGLPVLEAMACGTPVVTAATSSTGEVAGDAAVTVDPRDEAALGRALVAASGDSTLRARLRQLGLSRAREFSWQRTARETLAVYRRTATRSPRSTDRPGRE
jgi:glycosyltransferase involved in cell wall biosynthesis